MAGGFCCRYNLDRGSRASRHRDAFIELDVLKYKVMRRTTVLLETANSIEEFTKRISDLRNRWFGDWSLVPWCRGQERAEWPLVPKLYRGEPDDYQVEYEIREEFATRAPALSDYTKPSENPELNNWESYFLMQHYGAPTRLLDWTESSLIALYFAVRSNPGNFHAAVWVLDAWWLNRSVINRDEVIPPADPGTLAADRKSVTAWLPARFKKRARLPILPVAVLPTHTIRRISAQRSCFTIHGSEHDGFRKLSHRSKPRLVKIVIPSWEIRQIRRSLESCGIDETAIFPDLEALGRAIVTNWKSETADLPHVGVYTRLGRSKTHGVGVFAIRKIGRGTKVFGGDDAGMVWIDKHKTERLPNRVKKLYDDFAVLKNGRYGCPASFNQLTLSWYLNESRTHPNVRCDENDDFFATRDIKAGEGLLANYPQYSEYEKPAHTKSRIVRA